MSKSAQLHFIDTHCHVHDSYFFGEPDSPSIKEVVEHAHQVGVTDMVCVGTDVKSSKEAVHAARSEKSLYASLALHPHEAKHMTEDEMTDAVEELRSMLKQGTDKIVAIGECGLDYFYHSEDDVKHRQAFLLKLHIGLAIEYSLPMIFHVRDACDDFFEIVDEYPEIRGVMHSFTDSVENMQKAVKRGFYIGLNGIMTFTNDESQLAMAKAVPLNALVLETDAPFLTPKPFRGKICKPEHVAITARFLSELRNESTELLATATTDNAKQLFTIK